MTVKQNEAVKAYKSVQDLNKQKMNSGKLAKKIFELFSKLQPAFDFQTQEEKKILEAHPEFDPQIGGIRLEGKTQEEKVAALNEVRAIEKEFKELAELDFEVKDFEKFEINFDQINLPLSGEDIGNLEKFIDFTEDDPESQPIIKLV